MNYFEQATRLKLRFQTARGGLNVEDLWDLPLTSTTGKPNLNDIARDTYKKLNAGSELNFVSSARNTPQDTANDVAHNVVIAVIKAKEAENAAASEALRRKEQKQKILELIDRKKDETLAGKSVEELEALLAGL